MYHPSRLHTLLDMRGLALNNCVLFSPLLSVPPWSFISVLHSIPFHSTPVSDTGFWTNRGYGLHISGLKFHIGHSYRIISFLGDCLAIRTRF